MKETHLKGRLQAIALTACAAAMIWACRETAAEAKTAAGLCLTVMIPSLYAFTVLSKLMISTNTYKLIGRPFLWISRYILRMPAEFFPIFLISQFAGYPIGASLISQMETEGKITPKQAEEMLCFCIAPGPAYISAVAVAVAPDIAGMSGYIFLAVAGANLLGVLLTSFTRKIPPRSEEKAGVTFSASLFTESVRAGAESMAMICGMIIFMAAVMGILGKLRAFGAVSALISRAIKYPPEQIYPFVRSFLEISNLTRIFGDVTVTIPMATAMLSFGGICVHLQIMSVCRGFSPMKALLCRIPCSAAAFLICRLIMPDYFPTEAVAVNASINREAVIISHNQPILSIFLLIMTILIISQKTIVKNKKM